MSPMIYVWLMLAHDSIFYIFIHYLLFIFWNSSYKSLTINEKDVFNVNIPSKEKSG